MTRINCSGARDGAYNSRWIYCLNEGEGGGRSRKVGSNNVLDVACTQNSAAVSNATGFTPWNNPVLTQLCTNRPDWPAERCCCRGASLLRISLVLEKCFSCFFHGLGGRFNLNAVMLLWAAWFPVKGLCQETHDVWTWWLVECLHEWRQRVHGNSAG